MKLLTQITVMSTLRRAVFALGGELMTPGLDRVLGGGMVPGSLVLLVLFLFLVFRGFHLASRSQDRFASFACGGLTIYFLAHIGINLAMVCGLFPVVGIPLPFVSYGGAAMITFLLLIGLLQSIHLRAMAATQGVRRGRA